MRLAMWRRGSRVGALPSAPDTHGAGTAALHPWLSTRWIPTTSDPDHKLTEADVASLLEAARCEPSPGNSRQAAALLAVSYAKLAPLRRRAFPRSRVSPSLPLVPWATRRAEGWTSNRRMFRFLDHLPRNGPVGRACAFKRS